MARSPLHLAKSMRGARRRGILLFVVLVMVVLLSLLAASYSFMVNAHLETVMAEAQSFQVRMAADAGIQQAILALRTNRGDLSAWYDNEEFYRQAPLMYEEEDESEALQDNIDIDVRTYDPHAPPVVRFSLYGPRNDVSNEVRFGLTDECARLDINLATADQLRRLFTMVIPQDEQRPVDINVLVDSLLDWRGDEGVRANGAGDEFYMTLNPPYHVKKAPFSTVEELLVVRGFTAWVVFGEDYNQNGLIEPNEDDNNESFPPDNGDGILFRGVAHYLTVWSRDANTKGDNTPRVWLNQPDTALLEEELQEAGIPGDIISYIMGIREGGGTFNSIMNLIPAPPPPEVEEEPAAESPPPAATQPSGGEATSQPDNENDGGIGGSLTEENRSENAGAPLPTFANLTEEEPPGDPQDLPLLFDQLDASPPPVPAPGFFGQINVSTAPREVLMTIMELSNEEVDAIIAARLEVPVQDLSSPAWLLTYNVLDENRFRQLMGQVPSSGQAIPARITTRSSVFRIESVGFADHFGVVERILAVIEMRVPGAVPQVLYYRDLGSLGVAYNPYGEEDREFLGLEN